MTEVPEYCAVNLGYRMPPDRDIPMTGFGMTMIGPDGKSFPVRFTVEQASEIRRRIDGCIER